MKSKFFTLIELVISLALLAVLTTVMLSMAGGSRDRFRIEKTRMDGLAIQKAVERFLSDMGCYPGVCNTVGQGTVGYQKGQILAELFNPELFQNRLAERLFLKTDDFENILLTKLPLIDKTAVKEAWKRNNSTLLPELSMRIGWDGPYLNAPGGKLVDAWGEEWVPYTLADAKRNYPVTSGGTFPASYIPLKGTPFHGVRSLGANKRFDPISPPDPAAEDQDFAFYTSGVNTPENPGEKASAELEITFISGENGRLCQTGYTIPNDFLLTRKPFTTYTQGMIIREKGILYRCQNTYSYLNQEPKTDTASTVDFSPTDRRQFRDGQIVWERIAPAPHELTRIHIALAKANISPLGKNIETEAIIPDVQGVFTLDKISPGKHKLFALGYYLAEDKTVYNAAQSDPVEIELKPGFNAVTLTLDPLPPRP